MNSRMTTNSQLSTTAPKATKTKMEQKLGKQLEQEQNHRNHMQGYQWGGVGSHVPQGELTPPLPTYQYVTPSPQCCQLCKSPGQRPDSLATPALAALSFCHPSLCFSPLPQQGWFYSMRTYHKK